MVHVRRKHLRHALKLTLLVVSTCIILFPIYWIYMTSIRGGEELLRHEVSYYPKHPTLDHFRWVFANTEFPLFLGNSLRVAFFSTTITMIVSSLAAFSLSKYRWPGRSAVARLILFTYMVPQILLIIPIFLTMRSLGLLDTLTSLVVAEIAFAAPYCIWLLKGFFDGIPEETFEAGLVDGCNMLQAYRYIIVPLALPGLIAVAMFTVILSWNDYIWPLVFIKSQGNWTLPLRLAWYLGPQVSMERWGPMNAEAVLVSLPIFLVFWFLQRYVVEGMSAGAVK